MRWSSPSRRKSIRRPNPAWLIDALEARQMLSGETVSAIPAVLANVSNPAANSITLNQYFNDSTLPGTLATFDTNEGEIQVALTDAATPQTVANFLAYVNSGEYTNTIFHRSVDLNTGLGGSPEAPATIIQGGGYSISNGGVNHIATNAPVDDEYTHELYGDVAGTLAMAKTSEANSATSEWYFNVTDNTELDTPTVDDNGNTTSYTVFGAVLSGTSVISTIAALPTDNLGNGLDTVPVAGLSEAQIAAGATLTASNLIFTTGITTEPGTSYAVTSSNKSLVTPKVTDGVLSFTYPSAQFGTAEITITGTNLDGTSTSTIVDVTVPNPATPNAGPVATDITAPFTQTGTTGNFSVVGNDTDSLAALDPSSVAITTGPTHGTASVDTTTGHIKYTPDAGYIGADSLTYSIADANGTRSNVATVTLNAVPTPVVLTIGTPKAKSLIYTDPNGIVSHVLISGGTAAITFTDYRVTTTTKGGVVTATGLGATITNIDFTNDGIFGKVTINSTGPITIGSITSPNNLVSFYAPTATLTGTTFIGGVTKLTVAAALNATINLGKSVPSALNITNVADTSISSQSTILYIKSKQWINTDGGTYTISGINILDLEVPGTFADQLQMTATGYSILKANVTTPTAAWETDGSIYKASIGTPGANWSINSNGEIFSLAVKGNLANNIQAAAIASLTVSGTSVGSTIQTDATFSKKLNQIGKISFGGAISNTVIFSAGNIGSISTPSMTNSRIYAGVALTVAEDGKLAAATTDLSNNARISSVTLGKGTNTFVNALISADIIGALKLGNVNTTNNATVEGISAHTVSSISATLVPGGIIKAGAAQLKNATTLAAYEKLKKITLGDFTINLF